MVNKTVKVVGTFNQHGIKPFDSKNEEFYAVVSEGFPDEEGYFGKTEGLVVILAKSNRSAYKLLGTGVTPEQALTVTEERQALALEYKT